MDRWPHQERAVKEVLEAIHAGHRKILLTIPTGGGKTVVAIDLVNYYFDFGLKAVFYTNRKLLLDQTSRVFEAHSIPHGVRASGHGENLEERVQVSSIQTEKARRHKWEPHEAEIVVIDEAHLFMGDSDRGFIQKHVDMGAVVVGLTATPLDMGSFFDHLVIAGTTSELRACGSLVPCYHYGPDEPDLRHIGRIPVGEDLTESQNVKAMMVPGIFGRVYEWWKKLNPDGGPTLLFAPGVKESIWFAERFREKGVSVAHIDGKEVWINGEFQKTSQEIRDHILAESKAGRIQVVCNRFVLREGIDMPWIRHGIFATVFGSLKSYLQAGGRLLRKTSGKEGVTLTDHGGNWHRHGSLNADREWRLDYTSHIVAGLREERLRAKQEAEPFVCPQCAKVLTTPKCPCGYEVKVGMRSRPVIQSDGTMKQMFGDIYKERIEKQKPDTAKIWQSIYYRASRAGMTFRQAEGLFCHENFYWPPRTLPLMPREALDWFRKVADVPRERLR